MAKKHHLGKPAQNPESYLEKLLRNSDLCDNKWTAVQE